MASLKGCHCNHCRNLHKSTPIPRCRGRWHSSRHNSCSKIYTGDEHWTKVLQASEGQCSSANPRQPSVCHRHSHGPSICSCHAFNLSSCFVLNFRNPSQKRTKNVFQSFYSRFCNWFGSTCQGFGSSFLSRITSCNQSLRNNNHSERSNRERTLDGLCTQRDSDDVSTLLCRTRRDEAHGRCNFTSQSSEDTEFGSVWTSCSSSSSLTVASNSTLSSFDGCIPFRCKRPMPVSSEASCPQRPGVRGDERKAMTPTAKRIPDAEVCAFSSSTSRINSSHRKCSSVSLPGKNKKSEPFYKTWPLTSDIRQGSDSGKDDFTVSTCPSVLPVPDLCSSVVEEVFHESSVEWLIPYDDLSFDQVIKYGARHQIFRGRWHGDVLIHTYCDLEPREVIEFLKQVSELSRVRHENICLFMGACVQLPNLAVITSDLKGPSLYEKIHLLPDKISMRSRVNIARQASVAMGYLHAKGVLACKLNSRNIHLEPKVKLSLLDHGITETVHDRLNSACLPRGSLCYFAPELLSSLIVMDSSLHFTSASTQKTDVFAFGTLLYELFAERFPFSGNSTETLIWQVCKGRRPSLTHLSCNSALKILIERCWSPEPDNRPSFAEINQELQQKTGLHKCHSSSQPERLNQNGFQTAGRQQPIYRITPRQQ